MASDVILMDFMHKRSIMKGRFRTESYKGRWFLLKATLLAYYDGSPDDGKGKVKGQIYLRNVKVIEKVEAELFNNRPNAFQIGFSDDNSGEFYTLYVMALTPEKRDEWIGKLRTASKNCGAVCYNKYHNGVFQYKPGRWICCESIMKRGDGCVPVTWNCQSGLSNNNDSPIVNIDESIKKPEVTTPVSNIVRQPLPPVPTPSTKAKIMVMAVYDYQQVEDGDLALEKGEEYEIIERDQPHWWKAKNKAGKTGYIPANYVAEKKVDSLEEFDWYYPNTSRAHSEDILSREGKEGCFLVRDSSAKGMYTLSIFAREGIEQVVKHYHIKQRGNRDYYLTERHAHKTIPELINYHKHNCAGLIVRLRSSPASGRNSVTPATSGLGHDRYEIDPSELELLQDLGAGQFGTVKLALWKGKTKVAVKMMKEDTMSEDDFIDEAKTMRDLQHKNLVQLHGVSTKKKPIYIITEYMKNGSLLSYLKRHKVRLLNKASTLVDMCNQVCLAMEYLESKKFIHRDLAARNCLVGDGDVCKVGDFGLARFVLDDEYTSSQGTKFPIRWAPPEVLSYTRFSTKSDVWSFGILMWEVFSGGDMPYGRIKNQDVVNQVCNQNKRLEKPTRCSDDVYGIMFDCWHQKPENRPDFSRLHRSLDSILRETAEYVD